MSGLYNDTINVAVKVILDQEFLDEEMEIFEALDAINDPDIEKHGIAKVFYHGPVLDKYYAIVMTLFDGSFEDKIPKGSLSEIKCLNIFIQAVCVYLKLNEDLL